MPSLGVYSIISWKTSSCVLYRQSSENFRPGVMDRFGLGLRAMTTANPRLIYCSIPGFGEDDPRVGPIQSCKVDNTVVFA
jgi:CoA-transferase family III